MDDTISRQAAIDALDEQITQCDKALGSFDISMKDEYAVKAERASLKAYRETINVLPSADRPQGEWVEDTYGWVYCSHCKKYLDDYQMVFFLKPFDYCPNCGADMRGEQDDSV